jgi:hypothetical protein
MDINSPSRFWSALGKIALLVTVIGGLVALWKAFAPGGPQPGGVPASVVNGTAPRVIGTLSYFDFELPPDILAQIQNLRDLMRPETAERFTEANDSAILNKLLQRIGPSLLGVIEDKMDRKQSLRFEWLTESLKSHTKEAARLREVVNEELSNALESYSKTGWLGDNIYRTQTYSSYVICSVENAGERQAVGVELGLPYEGIAVVEEAGENPKVSTFNQKVMLGTILPKNEKRVKLWTSSRVTSFSFDRDKWRLFYVDGTGKLMWSIK